MADIEELEKLDKLKTKVLKYIMFKKRTEREIRRKFATVEDQDLLDDVIENLKEIGYIDDKDYVDRAVAEFMNLNNLSLKTFISIFLAPSTNSYFRYSNHRLTNTSRNRTTRCSTHTFCMF